MATNTSTPSRSATTIARRLGVTPQRVQDLHDAQPWGEWRDAVDSTLGEDGTVEILVPTAAAADLPILAALVRSQTGSDGVRWDLDTSDGARIVVTGPTAGEIEEARCGL